MRYDEPRLVWTSLPITEEGEEGDSEDMCYEVRRAEACVD
jgi:hypothetical protein